MTTGPTIEELRERIVTTLGIDVAQVSNPDHYDSLGVILCLADVEDEYGIMFDAGRLDAVIAALFDQGAERALVVLHRAVLHCPSARG